MANPINMPKLSDEMEEGKLAEWLKNEGDEIKAGDVVAQVETEKATLDVEAFDSGVLIAIVARKGETVPVGSPIAWLGERGEKVPGVGPAAQAPAPPVPRQAPVPAPPPAPRQAPAPAPPPSGARETPPTTAARTARGGGRIVASPAARKVARERGLDLAGASGSGPGGRVVLADLERVARAPAAPAVPSVPARRRRELPPHKALRDEALPLSPMRKAIARNLAAVKPGAPHFYLEVSADMRRAVALREQLNELGEGDVSLNDLVLKAVADALLRHPEMNASWEAEGIVRHGGVHVGMAVAVEEGLITPVLRDTDRLSILEIARATRELARRARDKRLKPEEYQGGTFTVSNLGMFGIDAFYAIINPPEAAILSVGAVQRVPWVDEASGEIVAVERCRFGLSGDHRVVDGATGARFLQTFKAIVESPVRLVVPAARS